MPRRGPGNGDQQVFTERKKERREKERKGKERKGKERKGKLSELQISQAEHDTQAKATKKDQENL